MSVEEGLTVTAPDRELTIEYQGRKFHLMAYATDIGVWDATAVEVCSKGPALPASAWGSPGMFREPYSALSLLTDAIIRKVDRDG